MSTPAALAPHRAAMADRAAALDHAAAFPAEDMALLRRLGLCAAPLPCRLGGTGAGTEPEGADAVFAILRLLGRGNASVGRLFEAHVNAVRLILRFGTPPQVDALVEDCRSGLFHGVWVTDAPGQDLRRDGTRLVGRKGPCSGAGFTQRALVTVTEADTVRMAVIPLSGSEPVVPIGDRLLGMRASVNGTVTLDGIPLPDTGFVGEDGDYLREPDLSTGAWRTMAVTLGLLEALVEAVRVQLLARGHDTAPLQQDRFGRMLIGIGTAQHWTWDAARLAENGTAPVPDQVAGVNLARIAVERACLECLEHAQRALGLGALVRPNPVERLSRDLATYLRQPAPDMVLTEAAAHGFGQSLL